MPSGPPSLLDEAHSEELGPWERWAGSGRHEALGTPSQLLSVFVPMCPL